MIYRNAPLLMGLLLSAVAGAGAQQVTKILDNGSDANKKVIAVFGDGYDLAHQSQFNTDVDNLILKGVFANDFFRENQDAFNVYRINVVSGENGVSTRTYDEKGTPSDPSDDVIASETPKNTPFKFIYSGSWAHCWMEGTPGFTENQINGYKATFAPTAQYTVFILNNDGFGGCGGGGNLVVTRTASWTTVAHEMGHGLGGLMDEYSASGKGAYKIAEYGPVNGINCTTEPGSSTTYWKRFINPATPFPTVLGPNVDANKTVGGFMGCGTWEIGILRPVYSCRMRDNWPNYCPVCYTHMRKLIFPQSGQTLYWPTLFDFTGDGKADLMLRQESGIHLFQVKGPPYGFDHVIAYNKTMPVNPGIGLWTFHVGDKFFPGDFDGDGKTDLFVYHANGRLLGLLQSTGSGFKVVRLYQDAIGAWTLNSTDKIQVGDFNGDKKADLFISTTGAGGGRAGIFLSLGTVLANTMYQKQSWTGWTISAGDRFMLGDFTGDGKTDLYIHNVADWNGTEYIGMLKADADTLVVVKTYANSVAGWTLAPKDTLFVGDFDGDKKADLYLWNNGADWNGVPYLGMFKSTGAALSFVKGYDNTSFPVPQALRKSDEHWVADVNKDGKDDLVFRNMKDWFRKYLGVMLSSGTALSPVSREIQIGGWTLDSYDQVHPAAYDGAVGKSGIIMNQSEYLGLFRFMNGNFDIDRGYYHWIYTAEYDRYPWSDGFPQ